MREFQEAHINTRPRIIAASIVAAILLIAAIVWLVIFLTYDPFDEATLSPCGRTVTIGEVNISTPNVLILGYTEVPSMDFSLGTRSSTITLTYDEPLSIRAIESYANYLARFENFWLIGKQEGEETLRVLLLNIIDGQGLLSVQIDKDCTEVAITYMLRSFGPLNIPFERAAAVDDFLGDFGLSAEEVLLDYEGLGAESITAYVETAGILLYDMTYEDAREFNRALWSFVWSLVILTFSAFTPFTILAIISIVIRVRRGKQRVKEAIPELRERYAEAREQIKEWRENNESDMP